MDVSGKLIARNTILNIGGKVLPLAVGILAIPWIIRGLGEERFGLLSLSWVVLNYLTIFDFGLGRATTRYVAQALGRNEPERVPSIVFSASCSQVIFGIIGAVVFLLITPILVNQFLNIPPYLIPEAIRSFQILAFSIPVIFMASSFSGLLEASQRFDLVNLVRVPSVSLTFLLPLLGVWAGFGLPGIMILLLFSRIFTLLSYIVLSLVKTSALKGKIVPSKDTFRKLIGFGGWITISGIVSPVLVYVDRFFIGSLITLTAVSYYAAPSEMITRLLVIPTSLVATLFPAFSALGETKRDRLEFFYAGAVKYLALGFGPLIVLIIFFSSQILDLWLGAEFASQSTLVLQILALGVFSNALARIPFSLLQGLGRPDITAKIHLVELPVHLVLAGFLVAEHGIAGAAAAWTIRATLDAAIMFLMCILLKITPWSKQGKSGVLQSLLMFLFLTVSFGAARVIGHNLIPQMVCAAVAVGIAVGITWRYALDATEKKYYYEIIRRFVLYRNSGR